MLFEQLLRKISANKVDKADGALLALPSLLCNLIQSK